MGSFKSFFVYITIAALTYLTVAKESPSKTFDPKKLCLSVYVKSKQLM